MKQLKFFKCKICGNVVIKLVDKHIPVFCCGQMMEELSANTVEASTEKHLPVVKVENGVANVTVGSVIHPMEQEHYINFIALQTDKNHFVATLQPGEQPNAEFLVGDDKVVAAYEYCNLHGLWKTEVK